jgi:hypothetical protein
MIGNWVSVSPGLARDILANARPHEHLNAHKVQMLADAMRMAVWDQTECHSPIIFDFDGCHLVDGQHRMHAVIRAGVTIRFWAVLWGRRQADARGHGQLEGSIA